MKLGKLIVVGALLLAACDKGRKDGVGAGSAGGPSPFDKRWEALQAQGSEAIKIVDDQGAALMDNVLGAQGGALAGAPWLAESMKGGGNKGPLPDRPDPNDVNKLVKQYVPGVKACYQRLTRGGDTRTGKAIVSFQIASNGKVQSVAVDAPEFEGSQLASCIDGQVSRWQFPPSKKGAGNSSYPFVFSGG
jgi:hypothetical protein